MRVARAAPLRFVTASSDSPIVMGQSACAISTLPTTIASNCGFSYDIEGKMLAAFSWILFGLIAGLIAKAILPGKDPGKFIGTTVIGMVGGVIGGYLGRQIGLYDDADPVGLIMAIMGALLVLILYRWLTA
jgi:uncharacterized membrane protein YeaQ/YmgE (transglycosylase-associated protein family)